MFTDKSARQVVRDEFLFPKNAFVFGYTGRMEQVKRLDLLLIAFQAILNQFPSARLLLIGDGKMRSRWMDLARQRLKPWGWQCAPNWKQGRAMRSYSPVSHSARGWLAGVLPKANRKSSARWMPPGLACP